MNGDTASAAFRRYYDLLHKWNPAINLVASSTLPEAWERHFADSEQLEDIIAAQFQTPVRIVDLGSGAGFPGMVLALLRPDWQVTLIESDTRKAEFLKTVSRETGASVTLHDARIESVIDRLEADIITARAFAPLVKILDMTAPMWRQNPALQLLLHKGKNALQEIEDAQQKYDFHHIAIPSKTEPPACLVHIKAIIS